MVIVGIRRIVGLYDLQVFIPAVVEQDDGTIRNAGPVRVIGKAHMADRDPLSATGAAPAVIIINDPSPDIHAAVAGAVAGTGNHKLYVFPATTIALGKFVNDQLRPGLVHNKQATQG